MTNIFNDISKVKYLGQNTIIGQTVRIRRPEMFMIGRNSIIDDFTYISCKLKVGMFTHIGSGSHIIGGSKAKVTIGNFVNIAPGCNIAAGQNNYSGGGLVGPAIPEEYGASSELKPVDIGDHCLLGFNVSILAGVRLPEGVAVGAYSLLKPMKYKPWTIYAGIPAKEIGKRNKSLIKRQQNKLLKAIEGGRL